MALSAAVSLWSWPFSWMVAAQARWPRACLGPGLFFLSCYSSARMGSVFRDFDANVEATTVTLLNIGNSGVPKNTNVHLGAQFFYLSFLVFILSCLTLCSRSWAWFHVVCVVHLRFASPQCKMCIALWGSKPQKYYTYNFGGNRN
ncbi:hypothetical protein B0H19DRAFT_1062366 [Mycena capillaripes]|nr:hypothetical protein B0H19DRAFT_1062366 [Mycena capillaripes]